MKGMVDTDDETHAKAAVNALDQVRYSVAELYARDVENDNKLFPTIKRCVFMRLCGFSLERRHGCTFGRLRL